MDERDLDRQLVERAQRGDKHAFELLVSKYQRKLTRLLARFIRDPVEVEDVAQEAFIKAYRALPSFRGDSAFYTWLYRIGINTAKNYLVALGRRAPTTTEFNSEDAEGFEDGEQLRDINTPESMMMSKEIAQTVNDTMERLPEELRNAITLRELEGLSYEDIATIMNCQISPEIATRVVARLREEPTVLAPRPEKRNSIGRLGWYAMSAAASVAAVALVVWTASPGWRAEPQLAGDPAATTAAPPVTTLVSIEPHPEVENYLLAHQPYSHRSAMQGIATYVRANDERGAARK